MSQLLFQFPFPCEVIVISSSAVLIRGVFFQSPLLNELFDSILQLHTFVGVMPM